MMGMEEIRLKDICDLDNGFAFKSDDYVVKSNTLNCRMSNIRPDSSFDILYNAKYLPDEFAEKYKDYILYDGDLIIAMTDMAGDPKILGVPTVVNTLGYNLLLNQRVGKLRLIKKGVNADYLKLALQCSNVRNYLKKFAGGGVQLNVSKKDILSVPILMRSENEQNSIAEQFSKVLGLKEKREQELKLLDNLIKARFVEMFGDVTLNDKLWKTDSWNNLLRIVNGKNQRAVESNDGEYVICGSGGIMGKARDYLTKENSVIVGRKGNINKPILMREKYWNVDTAFGLEPNNNHICVEYLYMFCLFFDFNRLNKAVTIPSLTKADLLNIEMPVPDLNIQNQFATFVHQVDKSKVAVQKALDETQLLFDSLMQKYFG